MPHLLVSSVRLLVLVAPVLACAVSASAATQSGGAPPAEGTSGAGKPAQVSPGASPADPASSTAGTAGGSGSAAPQACAPVLAETSTSLFSGRVLIRLPKGVELVEQNPFYAQAAAPQQATSCGAPVHFASVGYFEWPAGVDPIKVRNQLLELRGISLDTVTWSEEGSRGRHVTAAYAATQDPKTQAPPLRGWLVLRDAPNDKFAYFAMFETDEGAWNSVRAVFQEAGRHLLIKANAGQGAEKIAPPPKVEEPPPEPVKAKKKAAAK